jgi:hypothetical protein
VDTPAAELTSPPWSRVPAGTAAAPEPRQEPHPEPDDPEPDDPEPDDPEPALETDRLTFRRVPVRIQAPPPSPKPRPIAPMPRPPAARPPNRFSVAPRPTVVDDLTITGLTRLSRSRWGSRLFTLFFVFVFTVILLQLIDALLYPLYR